MKTISTMNAEHTKAERIITAALSFITFVIIGGVIRLFVDSVSLGSVSELLSQFLPFMLGFGCTAGVLAYFYPKAFQIITCFIPTPGSSS